MNVSLGRILLYVKDVESMALFYKDHFGFRLLREEGDRIVELESPTDSACNIMLHPLAKGRKAGQTLVKLLFDTEDVEGFCAISKKKGLKFGKIFYANGYSFANAKDPAGNSISVSSRHFRPQNAAS